MERGLLDRLLRTVTPKPDPGFTSPPYEIGSGIWGIDRRASFVGVTLPSRSTVIDVGAGRLLLISPPADAGPEIDRLGSVSAIVAPSSFHYLHAEPWLRRYPEAELFVAPELSRRVPGLPPAVALTAGVTPPWHANLSFVVLGPHRGISEVLFFHPASRTLILTDLASNLVEMASAYERVACRLSGMPFGFGPSRNARRLLLRDEVRAREALRAVVQWPFERIVMAHGAIVERDARQVFASAFGHYL
jgi:hypothetical protein